VTSRNGRRLRELLAGERCLPLASVFDPLSVRAAGELGYEAAFLAGSVASLAVLGAPDLNLLTLDEFAALSRRICRASPLPLLVDADGGYGNALNVRRTVEELAAAGVAGMTLEDTVLPQRFGEDGAMVSLAEAELKLAAAIEARPDPDFVIVARTSAFLQEGLQAACRRISSYAAAGADAIFVVGLKRRAELAAVREAACGLPIMAYAAGDEIRAGAELAAEGVRLLIIGHAPFAEAASAAYRTLAAQRDQPSPDEAAERRVARLSEATTYGERTKRYLATGAGR